MNTEIRSILAKVFLIVYMVSMTYVFRLYFDIPKFLIQTDVISFLTGAKIIKEGKTEYLYDVNTQLEYQNAVISPDSKRFLLPFRNFPVTAALYTPLLQMDLKSSYTAVFCVNIALLLLFHFVSVKAFPGLGNKKFLFLLPIFYYPSVSNLIVGQYTPVILLIFLSVYLLIRKENSFWTGFATALLVLKPQYLLFTPFSLTLSKNRKQYVLGFLVGLMLFGTLNLAVTGSFKPFLDYPGFILSTENSGFGSRYYEMFTLYGLVKQIIPQAKNEILIIGNFILYVMFTVLTIYKIRLSRNSDALFISGVLLTILFSVHALTHDLMVLLIPLYMGFVHGTDRGRMTSKILFIFPLVILVLSSSFQGSSSLGVLFMFLVFFLTIFPQKLYD